MIALSPKKHGLVGSVNCSYPQLPGAPPDWQKLHNEPLPCECIDSASSRLQAVFPKEGNGALPRR